MTIDLDCPGGEIGRRTVFRSQRSQGCAGSNPVPGTNVELKILTALVFKIFLCFRGQCRGRFGFSGNYWTDLQYF